MKQLILTLGLLLLTAYSARADKQGTWKAYMAYADVQDVEQAGKLLFVKASDNLYAYNTADQSIQTFDRAGALTDVSIKLIKYCPGARKLIVVYSNSNIDLLSTDFNVENVSSLYDYSTTEDKNVNYIGVDGKYAYLCTGFGILKMNVADGVISDTYNLGEKISWCQLKDGYIHAYGTNGHLQARLTDNLIDKANWKNAGSYEAPPSVDKTELMALARTLSPGGQKYNPFGMMRFLHGNLYTVTGGYNPWVSLSYPGAVQVLRPTGWQIYDDSFAATLGHDYLCNLDIAVDPTDTTHVFASGRTGLYEFRNGKLVKDYNTQNSILWSALGGHDDNYLLIEGIAFDAKGSLWILNSLNDKQALLELPKGGTLTDRTPGAFMQDNHISLYSMISPIFDRDGKLWFTNHHWVGSALCQYDPATDSARVINRIVNEDGTAYSTLYFACVTEDADGNLWVGTNIGPFLLENAQKNEPLPVFNQIKVPRNDGTDLADYLLSGVSISSIAIDGAGRKWFATQGNGVYLISKDNNTQVHHFTKSNSKLLSDDVNSIAINPATGEVFFATDVGLCSYMSDATATVEQMDKNTTWAYPNPVRPDYNGPITIKGLSMDADIKIVTASGALVNEGKSNGGSYVWDGLDKKGRRVASGVYMVLTATADGSKGTVCKIAVVK